MNKDKIKQYALWVAIFAFIPLLMEAFGLNILPENYAELTKALLGILVLAGIISTPQKEEKVEEVKEQE